MSAFFSRYRALFSLLPCLILMFLAFGFTACAPRETPIVSGTTTQTLHRGIGNDLADLDPHLATQAADYNVLSALLEGLVAEDPVDLHPVPGVAQSWTISPDGRTYTFRLRTDARWSNGASVTAGDFVDSWRRMLTPTLGADSANLLYIIQGAEAFHKSTAPWSAVGLAAPDARTFIVTLEHPAPHFLALLNHTAFFPVYLPAIEKAAPPQTAATLGPDPALSSATAHSILKPGARAKSSLRKNHPRIGTSPTYG
jgi:oligopeptide transport system substrate-binding protein